MTDGTLSRQMAWRLIEAAVAAPSLRDIQPWRFIARLADRVIEVYADPARTLQRGDPQGRAVHIACGAALFNLRLAVAHQGAQPLARLLPRRQDPLLLASVRLGGPYRAQRGERELYEAIQLGQAGGRPSGTGGPPASMMSGLAEAAAREGASFRILDQPGARRIRQLATRPDAGQPGGPGKAAALTAWAGRAPSGAVAGTGDQFAVLSTIDDDRASWLRAGQALQRILLLAAHRGMTIVPLMPPQESQQAAGGQFRGGHAGMILRMGGGQPGGPDRPAPRRPMARVLRVIAPDHHDRDEGPGEAPHPALSPAGLT